LAPVNVCSIDFMSSSIFSVLYAILFILLCVFFIYIMQNKHTDTVIRHGGKSKILEKPKMSTLDATEAFWD